MKKVIRLTESDLHRIVRESVRKLLKEHDPDDPDYGQYGDYYDEQHWIEEYENEASLQYWINPTSKEIFEDGEEDDNCTSFTIVPKFIPVPEEEKFEINNIDYEFYDKSYAETLGPVVEQYIDTHYEELCDKIVSNADFDIDYYV